eukprot:GFUD01010375.1.p1 GENE.GFUD01010375.1~~GFUD01010375.1.p1  ORF type:complete len:1089 (-),score=247.71 GFUD01010375.1:82-3348(-)
MTSKIKNAISMFEITEEVDKDHRKPLKPKPRFVNLPPGLKSSDRPPSPLTLGGPGYNPVYSDSLLDVKKTHDKFKRKDRNKEKGKQNQTFDDLKFELESMLGSSNATKPLASPVGHAVSMFDLREKKEDVNKNANHSKTTAKIQKNSNSTQSMEDPQKPKRIILKPNFLSKENEPNLATYDDGVLYENYNFETTIHNIKNKEDYEKEKRKFELETGRPNANPAGEVNSMFDLSGIKKGVNEPMNPRKTKQNELRHDDELYENYHFETTIHNIKNKEDYEKEKINLEVDSFPGRSNTNKQFENPVGQANNLLDLRGIKKGVNEPRNPRGKQQEQDKSIQSGSGSSEKDNQEKRNVKQNKRNLQSKQTRYAKTKTTEKSKPADEDIYEHYYSDDTNPQPLSRNLGGFVSKFEKREIKEDKIRIEKKIRRNSKCVKLRSGVNAFFRSRWMGLVLGPLYGLFIYFYIYHLILRGPPFTMKTSLNATAQSIANTIEKPTRSDTSFKPLMSKATSRYIGLGIGTTSGLALTVGSIYSVRTRCSMLLMIPSLMTKRGRGFMLTFLTSLVIEGPVNTIDFNLQEVIRSFTCMYEEIKSLAERFGTQFADVLKQVRQMLLVVQQMVNEYKNHLAEIARTATASTRRKIEAAQRNIEEQTRKIKAALDPLKKIANFPGKVIGGVCKAGSAIAGGLETFGKGLYNAGKAAVDWIGNLFGRRRKRGSGCGVNLDLVPDIDVNFPNVDLTELKRFLAKLRPDLDLFDMGLDEVLGEIDSTSIKNIRDRLKMLLKETLNLVKKSASWWSKIFYLTLFFLVLDAFKYLKKYYSDDAFDNMFVDDNLRKKWNEEGREKLTPIRRWELNENYKAFTSIRLSKEEIKRITIQSIPSLIILFIIFGIVVVDLSFSKILEAFQEHAQFGVSFPGMEKGITFNSLIGDLQEDKIVNLQVEAFNLTTDPCLPKAKRTDPDILGPIAAILLLCLASCILDAYASRLRAKICNFFYEDRAKERANYLYNKLQAGRRARRDQLQMIVWTKFRQRERANEFSHFFTTLLSNLPFRKSEKCLGCARSLVEPVEYKISRGGYNTTISICSDCSKDV